jgi:nucleotide-binding universal stress UspA family protein
MTTEPTTDGFTRILVATDFSPTSEGAWLAALRLAKPLGAEIIVLHVLVEAPLFSEGPFTMKHARNVFEAARAWVEKTLGEWVATTTTAGVRARWTVSTGVPYKEIVAAAESERPDFIVMGTQGRGGLDRALLGSVAEKVIRLAPCPVLTVRETG